MNLAQNEKLIRTYYCSESRSLGGYTTNETTKIMVTTKRIIEHTGGIRGGTTSMDKTNEIFIEDVAGFRYGNIRKVIGWLFLFGIILLAVGGLLTSL